MNKIIILPILLCAACANAQEKPKMIGMPNPASVNCIDKGGKLEIRKKEGGEVGYCTLPDGIVCEEWKLFRDECPPAEEAEKEPAE